MEKIKFVCSPEEITLDDKTAKELAGIFYRKLKEKRKEKKTNVNLPKSLTKSANYD